MRLRNVQVIGITLALLVGVLTVAGPWFQASLCETMMTGSGPMRATTCAADAGSLLTAKCGMITATREAAVAAPKAPSAPDLLAMTGRGVSLPAATAARTVSAPPGDPPRLVLDTSRLRI